METSMAMGVSKMVGLYKGKSHLEIDDDWGYPYFRKPPYGVWLKKKQEIFLHFLTTFKALAKHSSQFDPQV